MVSVLRVCYCRLSACLTPSPTASLIRGRGEILEEAVSQRRHQQINKQATLNDGANFQKEIAKRLVK